MAEIKLILKEFGEHDTLLNCLHSA